jgi:hypothetical protein
MTTSVCSVPIRVSKNNREIDPTEDERQGIVQNITKQAYWHVSSCKPGKYLKNSIDQLMNTFVFQVMVWINYLMII